MDCSMPGLPVPYHLPKFAQVHVHCIRHDSIQSSPPLMPFSPSALNLSHHQGLFQWVISSHQMNKTLELQLYISPSSEYSGLISLRLTGLIFLLEITKDSPNVSDCLEISKGMNFIYIYIYICVSYSHFSGLAFIRHFLLILCCLLLYKTPLIPPFYSS